MKIDDDDDDDSLNSYVLRFQLSLKIAQLLIFI